MSERKLLKELSAWVDRNSERTKQDLYLSSFLAIKKDVQIALNSGYSAKAVWGFFRDKGSVSYTYRTFLKYVNTYIKAESDNKTDETIVTIEENISSTVKQEVQQEPQGEKEKMSFKFDPVPNKDELI